MMAQSYEEDVVRFYLMPLIGVLVSNHKKKLLKIRYFSSRV